MKNVFRLSLSLFILCLYACSSNSVQKKKVYRIMTYNIHHGEGMDDVIDISRIGQIILDANPDIAGLQEVDSIVERSQNLDIMQLLAKQTNMHAVFGHSILLGEGKYGNGILSKEKPIQTLKISLPGADEARSAIVAEFEEYVVVNTHLSLDAKEREESVDMITKAISDYKKPVFLLGDLNDTPESKPMKLLENNWQVLTDTTIHTFPSIEPDCTIDYIWGYRSKGCSYEVDKNQVVKNEIASDHRPLFVDVRFKAEKSERNK